MALLGLGHSGLALCAGWVGGSLAGGSGHWEARLLELLPIGLALAIVKAAGQIGVSYWEVHTAREVGAVLRRRVGAVLLRDGSGASRRVASSTLSVCVREIEAAVASGLIAGARAVAQLVPLAAALIFVSPPLALGGVLLLVPFAIGLGALRRRLRSGMEAAQRSALTLHASVDELVDHLDVFRSYGAGSRILASIAHTASRATTLESRASGWRAALSGANEVLGVAVLLGLAVAVSVGGARVDGATLLAFAAVFFLAYRPLRDLGDARGHLERGQLALEALEALASPQGFAGASPPAANDWPPSVKAWSTEPEAFDLRLTGFGAAERGPVVDLVAHAGQVVALVGPTGSGKTTILRALLGLDPATGRLLCAGRDLTRAPVGPEHRPVAWVPQDAPLVTGSVLDNVALCAPTRAAALAALDAVGGSHLARLGDVLVGAGGRALSGGERRLVALARAWATGLPLLLLDEPTEGLDPQAAAAVLDAIRRMSRGRIVLLVTHHDAVLRIADSIVRLDQPALGIAAAE